MRKLLMALFVMFAMAGLVIAAEVTVTSYDKDTKTLKYKDADDKDHTAKVGKDAKFTVIDKDGKETASDSDAFEKRVSGKGKKAVKVDITVKDDVITEAKWKAGGKGKN